MEIDIVTVVKNGAETIMRTLSSLERQSIMLHHIIIDGQSTDGTLDIISKSKTKHQRKVFQQNGSGISQAFNQGISHAKTPWLFFLNADDWLEEEALKTAMDYIREHPNTDIFCGIVNIYSQTGRFIARSASDHHKITKESSIHHAATIFSSRFFQKSGNFNPDFRYAMDYDLFLRGYYNSAKFVNMPLVLANRQLGGASNRQFLQAILETRKARSSFVSGVKLEFWFVYALCKELLARFVKLILPSRFYAQYWSKRNKKIASVQ